MRDHQGDYGIDGSFHRVSARGQAVGLGAQVTALAVWAGISWARGRRLRAALAGLWAAGLIALTALYIRATRIGKFTVWNRILDDLRLRGDETVLDLGCGRGAVLRPGGRLAIADLWGTRRHAAYLRESGWRNVRRRNLGWRMWYGGPWVSTHLVTATKPD